MILPQAQQTKKNANVPVVLFITTAIIFAVVIVAAFWASGRSSATFVLPWFLPAQNIVLILISASVAFLAFGRYQVLQDPASFWIGVGNAQFVVGMIFNTLTFPGLVHPGQQVIGTVSNTPAWNSFFTGWMLTIALLVAPLARRPKEVSRLLLGLRFTIALWVIGAVALYTFFILIEEHIPVVMGPRGVVRSASVVMFFLVGIPSGAGAIISARRSHLSGDPMLSYLAVSQLTLLAVPLLNVVTVQRFDILWYVNRFLWAFGFAVMLFGLLSEYVHLFWREQEKTRELEKIQEHLRHARDELEVRVQERTAELSEALEKLRAETEERLQAVEQVRAREQMLIQQSRLAAMGEMLVNISHQWRQPLNVVGILLQDLTRGQQKGTFTPELLEKNVSRARELISHMSQTIDDFRSYLNPEKTKLPFDLREVVNRTLSLVGESLRGVQVEVRSPEDQPIMVNGFRNEFAQVLINILLNARDAFRERGVEAPRIIVTVAKEDGASMVTIADNAGGIAADVIDRVFEPYFTTKGPDKGTGIGLFMSRNIIEKNMAGHLTVRNTAEGAEFRIEV